jgi:putative Mn2+ efflux pump MntP
MNILVVLSIAFALALDAFAVSVGISLRPGRVRARQAMRLSFSFGFFQFVMPVLGWLGGTKILLIGCRMIYASLRSQKEPQTGRPDPSRGWSLLILSIATSLDALAVGLSFAAIGMEILYPSVLIGVVAFLMTLLGTKLGPLFGQIVGRRAEFVGGLVLIVIGIKILIDHL